MLLDPTLNQRPDFPGFLRLLSKTTPAASSPSSANCGPRGSTPPRLPCSEANFSEVEIGLQSLDPHAQELMGRKIDLPAWQRGVRALLDAGISVRVDLILGLPGDTPESVRRGIEYLRRSGLYTAVQVFNLSILPGTAFRSEAAGLGLKHQPRPPYYVLQTPTLSLDDMYDLMDEAQTAFDLEYDPLPPPRLNFPENVSGPIDIARIDLDAAEKGDSPQAGKKGTVPFFLGPAALPPAPRRAQAFTLWLRSADFTAKRQTAAGLIRQVLTDNPHTTLQVILEPAGPVHSQPRPPGGLSASTLESLLEACHPSAQLLGPLLQPAPKPAPWGKAAGDLAAGRRTLANRAGLDRRGGPIRDNRLTCPLRTGESSGRPSRLQRPLRRGFTPRREGANGEEEQNGEEPQVVAGVGE